MRDFKQLNADAHKGGGDFTMTSSEVLMVFSLFPQAQSIEDMVEKMESVRSGNAQYYGRRIVLRDE